MSLTDGPKLVTLVFADIQQSTLHFQEYGSVFIDAVAAMHQVAKAVSTRHVGDYVKNTGDGFLLAFPTPFEAVLCARDIQSALLGKEWDKSLPRLEVRMGIHTDASHMRDGEYTWPISWRTSRIMNAANGRQILLSEPTYVLCQRDISAEPTLSCQSLGSFRLKDLLVPEALFRLDISDLSLSTSPPRALLELLHNFPVEERPFIGRQENIKDVLRLFREHNAQLVTITGVGGIGKSRLARQSAALLAEEFPDGIWLVEMEALTHREEVLGAICNAIGLDARINTEELLQQELATQKMLLVLDCFEHLIGSADLIEQIMRFASFVRCLVTSRTVLHLPREFEYELSPMPTGKNISGSRLHEDSTALFVEAARHVLPDFNLTPKNRLIVQEICAALEGIPLSIIIAASRLRYLSPSDLLAEIKASLLDILIRPPTAEGRHDGLQRVIGDSFRLLSEPEQQLLCQFSVFVGGFCLEDARKICQIPGSLSLLQGIARLRDNSLLIVQKREERTRYKLLDTVREYLHRIITQTEGREALFACYRRHAEHYAQFAQQISAQIQQGDLQEGPDVLWREVGNLRSAVQFSIQHRLFDLIVVFADGLARNYYESGRWPDFEELAGAAEQAAEVLNRPDITARMLGLRGSYAMRFNDRALCMSLWERRVALSIAIGDAPGAISTLLDLADVGREAGCLADTDRFLSQSIELARTQSHSDHIVAIYAMLAQAALDKTDATLAGEQADRAWQVMEDSQDIDAVMFAGLKIGNVYKLIGAIAKAEAAFYRVIRVSADSARSFALSRALLELGELYEEHGRLPCAAYAYAASCRALAHAPSRRQLKVNANMKRFYQDCTTDLQDFVNSLSNLSQDDMIARLSGECSPP